MGACRQEHSMLIIITPTERIMHTVKDTQNKTNDKELPLGAL